MRRPYVVGSISALRLSAPVHLAAMPYQFNNYPVVVSINRVQRPVVSGA